MSKGLAAVAGWRGVGAAIAPYVLLAVFVPGGLAIAPLLYWRNRKRSDSGPSGEATSPLPASGDAAATP